MRRKRYTDEQIAFALRQAEGGTAVEELCRKLGVSGWPSSSWCPAGLPGQIGSGSRAG